jgi:hypothetical protein
LPILSGFKFRLDVDFINSILYSSLFLEVGKKFLDTESYVHTLKTDIFVELVPKLAYLESLIGREHTLNFKGQNSHKLSFQFYDIGLKFFLDIKLSHQL